jgi:hypothetical protein
MDLSYLLNTNSQNIVQCAAAQRAVTTADVQKMTQTEERQSAVFTELYTARTANSRFQRKAGVPVWSSTSAVTTALIVLLGIGVAEEVAISVAGVIEPALQAAESRHSRWRREKTIFHSTWRNAACQLDKGK